MGIQKAIILAAGYGTRFLPMTKAMPKEMLPVVDKPVIQYVVEDAVAGGIKDIVIVTSAQKRSIEDHFDYSFELESVLSQGGKEDQLKQIREIADLATFIYIRQRTRGTLGAFRSGYEAIGNEPFLGLWGDDFFIASPTRAQQLLAAYDKYKAPILGAFETEDPKHSHLYGFVDGKEVEPGLVRVERIVEKPGPENVPSKYAIVSGFVLTPEVMSYGEKVKPAANGEFLYTDAIAELLKDDKPVYALKIQNGTYYDCGNKLDYIKTNIELALANEQMGDALKEYLSALKFSK
jgi:UTP--glucose-1-phosphate uridylyltransferase